MALVENVRKRMLAKTRLDKNDVMAVEKLVKELGSDIVLYHHPQKSEGDIIIEHLRLAICTQVQRSMVKEFGKEMIFMDAVFGLSRYGFPMLTLVVRDEFGHGFPAAYCITSTEDSAVWQEFLLAVLKEADLDPKDITFMIDKSTIEISAIENIGAKYLLCKFHMLQEWERFLKSAESGVSGPINMEPRKRILWQLSFLQKVETETTFRSQSDYLRKPC
jgi:MULE transposase domain